MSQNVNMSEKFEFYTNGSRIYARASYMFRDCVVHDDVEGAKNSIKEGGKYPVTDSEVKNAAYRGCMKCLRWLVEDMKIPPCHVAIPYSLEQGKHNSVIYLLQHEASVTTGSVSVIFDHYRVYSNIVRPTIDEIAQYEALGLSIDDNPEVSTYMRIALALSDKYQIPITDKHLGLAFIHLWWSWTRQKDNLNQVIQDICHLLRTHPLTITNERDYIISRCALMNIKIGPTSGKRIKDPSTGLQPDWDLFKGDLSIGQSDYVVALFGKTPLDILGSLISVSDMSLSTHIINYCFDACRPGTYSDINPNRYQIMWNNFKSALKQFSPIKDESYPLIQNVRELNLLLDEVTFTATNLDSWLHHSLSPNLNFYEGCALRLINFLTERNRWEEISLESKLLLIIKAIKLDFNIFDALVQAINWHKPIRWVDFEKIYGAFTSKYVRKHLHKTPPKSTHLIDFSEPKSEDYQTKWVWVGVNQNPKTFGTYVTSEYIEHPVNPLFKDIRTLEDVKQNKYLLNRNIRSVTACYFNIHDDVFYHDQQDCVIWALDDQERVYVKDADPYIKRYVAKSLPEFLSHIYDDNEKWYHNHRG